MHPQIPSAAFTTQISEMRIMRSCAACTRAWVLPRALTYRSGQKLLRTQRRVLLTSRLLWQRCFQLRLRAGVRNSM